MAVSKTTAHKFIEALQNHNINDLVTASVNVCVECEEIWCYIDYHNKSQVLTQTKRMWEKPQTTTKSSNKKD